MEDAMALSEAAPAALAHETIHATGDTIAVRRSGKGPAILCLHATGHGARDFDGLALRMGGRAEFIAVDFPGHGDSPGGVHPASAARYAEIVAGAVEALGLKRYVIMGNSIGGAAAIIHAATHPEKVRALVLCNPGGLQPVNLIARFYCRSMAKLFARGEHKDPHFARDFRRYYEKTVLPARSAAWRREEIIAQGYLAARALREAWESFARPEADIRRLTPIIKAPVLYAWAKGDAAIAWSRCRKAALAAADASVEMFPGGHASFLEAPDAFDAALGRFLDRIGNG
jgi:pimeloyl-ACP methyl ester carboxylesterase